MKVIGKVGKTDLATVYISENRDGKRIEFVESLQPPFSIEDKWVNILSTLYGCPVKCPFCDAGSDYRGILSLEELLYQVKYLVDLHFQNNVISTKKWKIQFARMGEPAFNKHVLKLLTLLPTIYDAPGLLPSLSTIAPKSCDQFFDRLLDIKKELYPKSFQLQFSLHTTDEFFRKNLISVSTWSFADISSYGEKFFSAGGKKISLNFALTEEYPVIPKELLKNYSPDIFLIKLTPMNPTNKVIENKINSIHDDRISWNRLADDFRDCGYEVIESIGEFEENAIGSNCGQYLNTPGQNEARMNDSYSYHLESI
ncbi:radical SAM protein [bacterium]|nr:radical SAM protein [bacterium]